MKNTLLFVLPMIYISAANAATPWWEQPTVCRLNPTNCYSAMGAGFESGMWDSTSNCWGLKLICPEALTEPATQPIPIERTALKSGKGILSDFDTDALSASGDCYGRRKSSKNGATVSVNGKYVNVYCPGILDNPDETLENGEIVYNNQPTCQTLAESGYVATLNDDCFGKYYDISNYFIECGGTSLLPARIIILNGADYNITHPGMPQTMDAANKMFETMYSTSKIQHDKYFKNK